MLTCDGTGGIHPESGRRRQLWSCYVAAAFRRWRGGEDRSSGHASCLGVAMGVLDWSCGLGTSQNEIGGVCRRSAPAGRQRCRAPCKRPSPTIDSGRRGAEEMRLVRKGLCPRRLRPGILFLENFGARRIGRNLEISDRFPLKI